MKKADVPFAPINSVRVLLYRPSKPLTLVVREGSAKGRYVLLGGKIEYDEDLRTRVAEEVREESEVKQIFDIRHVTTVYVQQRLIDYPLEKWGTLGYATHQIDPAVKQVVLANQIILVFAAWADAAVPDHEVEGRAVRELDIFDEENLARLRPRHRIIAQHWRDHIVHGSAVPTLLYYEEDE